MKWVHRVFLALGFLFLAVLLFRLDPGALASKLCILGWIWIPLLAIEGLGELLHALGWRNCLSGRHRSIGWVRITMIRQAGMAFNYLTPTAQMGGELVKGTLLGREAGGSVEAAASVITGKFALVTSNFGFVVLGSLISLWVIEIPIRVWVGWAAGTILFSSGILAFFLLQRMGKLGGALRAAERMGIRKPYLQNLTESMSQLDRQLTAFYRERRGDFLRAVVFHLAGFSCGIFETWIFLWALGRQDTLGIGLVIWFLGAWFDLIGFMVPAGVGLQEGSRVLIFHELGMASLAGLTFGIVLRFLKLFWAMAGLGCYGLLLRRPPGGHPGGRPAPL